MQCKHCGAEVTGNFCPRCGEPAEEILRQCPVCGKAREDDEQFCTQCGYCFGKERESAPTQKAEPVAAAMQPAETGAQPAISTPLHAAAAVQPAQAAEPAVQPTPTEATVQPAHQSEHAAEKQPSSEDCAYMHIRRYERTKRWSVFFFFLNIFIILNYLLLEYYSAENILFIAVASASAIISLILLLIAISPIRKWSPKKIKSFGLYLIAFCSVILTVFGISIMSKSGAYFRDTINIIYISTLLLGQTALLAATAICALKISRDLKLMLYGTEKVSKDTPLLPQYEPFDFEKIKQEYEEFRRKQEEQKANTAAFSSSSAAFGAGAAASSAAYSASDSSSSIGHIRLYDTIVHKKDWKRFRKHATQAELTVLAIGSRSRLTGPRFFIKSIVAVAGMILSVVFGIAYSLTEYAQFGIILLIGGYLFFNLLASKQIGYSDTYSSCYWKLSGEYSKMVKELFKEPIALTILREILLICLRIVTTPYQCILIIIETLIPSAANWTVAHGGSAGAVVTLPKGYNIGNLAALGDYYKSCTFGAAWEQHMENTEAARLAKFSQYEYTDKYGVRQIAYSDDGRTFYTSTDKLQQVGTSQDNGRTIDLK